MHTFYPHSGIRRHQPPLVLRTAWMLKDRSFARIKLQQWNEKRELHTIDVNRAISRPTVNESLTGGVHGAPVGAYERGGHVVTPQGLHAVVVGVPDVIPAPREVLPPADHA